MSRFARMCPNEGTPHPVGVLIQRTLEHGSPRQPIMIRRTFTLPAVAKTAAAAAALVLGAGIGLASVDALPDPAQRLAAQVLAHAGVDVPEPPRSSAHR